MTCTLIDAPAELEDVGPVGPTPGTASPPPVPPIILRRLLARRRPHGLPSMYITSTATVAYGTVATPVPKTKEPLRIPFTAFHPQDETVPFLYTDYLTPNQTPNLWDFQGLCVLPRGITLTAVAARLFRATTSDQAQVVLYRVDDSATLTLLGTMTHATTLWDTVSVVLAEVVGAAMYLLRARLANATAVHGARLLFVDFDYTTPSVDKGI